MIEKLENNEQVLLMYLADELPAQDRLEVEQMLGIDTSLHNELSQLQLCQSFLNENMAMLDDASPMPVSIDFASRQVAREIRQSLVRPKASPVVAKVEHPVRSMRWVYPAAVAASILILGMIWLGRQATPTQSPYSLLPHMPNGPVADPQSEANVSLLLQSLQSPEQTETKPVTSSDDDGKQIALSDGMPQDEISQYLLNASTTGN